MSGIQSITYLELVNLVKNWIKTNCANIVNYGDMNEGVKQGYSYTVGTSGTDIYVEKATATLVSPLSSIRESQVDNDMNHFLSMIGVSNYINNNISDNNFFGFINNMVSFVCSRVVYIINSIDNTGNNIYKYKVYTLGSTYEDLYQLTTSEQDYIISANTANDLIQYLISLVNNNLRCYNTRYTFTIKGSL